MKVKLRECFLVKGNIAGIFHSSTWYNPANCPAGANEKSYLFDYDSQDNMSNVKSMLLAAYMADKDIKIGVHASKCYAGRPVIERVAFKRGF